MLGTRNAGRSRPCFCPSPRHRGDGQVYEKIQGPQRMWAKSRHSVCPVLVTVCFAVLLIRLWSCRRQVSSLHVHASFLSHLTQSEMLSSRWLMGKCQVEDAGMNFSDLGRKFYRSGDVWAACLGYVGWAFARWWRGRVLPALGNRMLLRSRGWGWGEEQGKKGREGRREPRYPGC